MKIESLKYPEYKHSGIDWLGAIPKHWKVRQLKFISRVQSSSVDKKSKDDEDEVLLCNYVDVYKNEFIDDSIEFMKATAPQRHIEQFTLNQGDIIITKDSEDRFDIAVPAKVNKDFENVLCGYHLALIRPDNGQISSGFLFRWFQSDLVNDQFKVSANGITRYGLSVSSIKDSIVAVPSLPEQKAIASFLDHQTTRIDQLIEKKKRLLELLDKQRQAIITNAVTKGINPDAPMKDSGIDWLGEVPEHWELNRLKFYTQINPVKSEVKHLPDDFEVTFTPMEAVKEFGGLDTKGVKTKGDVYAGYTYFKEGDVLTAKITPCFENAKATIASNLKNGIGFGTTELHVLRPFTNLNNRFLFFMIISEPFLKVGESEMLGAGGQKRVRQEFLENWVWAFPSIDEQRDIVSYIEEQLNKFDQLKTKIQTAINKLEEYRSSLITQAVTGKIDVRDTVQEVEMSYAAEEGELYKTNE